MSQRNYLRLASMIFNQPVMATPDVLDMAVRWANQSMQLNIINMGDAQLPPLHASADGQPSTHRALMGYDDMRERTGVAVVPVHGLLVSRNAHLEMCEVMTSYEQIRAGIVEAVNDSAVQRIVLDLDTNGGHVNGAFELADDIRRLAREKPITAIVNHSAYSAGYLVAASCTELVLSKTAGVGSIGVIGAHLDRSQMNEKMGLKVTTIYAGAHKNDGTPHEPLTEQAYVSMKAGIDEAYEMFVEAISTSRGLTVQQVRETEAATYRGSRSISIGLADRLATPQDTLDALVADVRASRGPSQSIALRAKAADLQAQI